MNKQQIDKLAEGKWLEYRDNVHKTICYRYNDFEKELFIEGFKLGLLVSKSDEKEFKKL
jgi:hypothetical protein